MTPTTLDPNEPTFLIRVDVAALLTEFLQNVRTDEVITELLQNEIDEGASTPKISFQPDPHVVAASGRPVGRAGRSYPSHC